jgi:putative transposase
MSRQRLGSTTDLTDEAWPILDPLLPPEKSGGRPRTDPVRAVMHGMQ